MAISNIRLGGINSGFDTEAMIEQMMSSYQTKIDNQNKKLTKLQWQQEAYQDIIGKMKAFQSKYFDILNRNSYLLSSSTFNRMKTNIISANNKSTNGFHVTTSSSSAVGSYKVKVNQVATSATVKGKSVTPSNFKLDFDKAITAAKYTDITDEDGNVTGRNYEFSLDVQVGSVTKAVTFSAEAALNEEGEIDVDALKQDLLDSLNSELQTAFGRSGRTGANATGVLDDDGNEWFLQAEMGADGNVEFRVGGNAAVYVGERKGDFGMSRPDQIHHIDASSAVTGTNSVTVSIDGVTKRVDFEGVSATYYESREEDGNGAILEEYNKLKEAAYRKANKLSSTAEVTQEQLDKFKYTEAQAAKDKNSAALTDALNAAFKEEGHKFQITGDYITASNKYFAISSSDGGTLGLSANNTASSSISSYTELADMGIEFDENGESTFTINGVEIKVTEDDTIGSLMDKVNKSDAGVTMTYSALTNSFTVTANEKGGGGKVEIEGTDLTRALGLTDENGDEIGYTQGHNAILEINGEEIYLNDNSYTMDGITFSFDDGVELGEMFTVDVSKDYDSVKDLVKSFIEDYNQLIDDVYNYVGTAPQRDNKNNRYEPLTDAEKAEMSDKEIEKWEEAAKSGVLYNDSTVMGIMSQIRSALYNSITLEDGSTFGLYNMGITTSTDYKEHGKLIIKDEDKFNEAFEKNAEAIEKLFTDPNNGIMKKVSNIVDSAINDSVIASKRGSLVRKAGTEGKQSVTMDSNIYKEMLKIKNRISDLQTRYNKREEYWWSVFTNLESMMADLNSQSNYLAQYLGSFGNSQ